jgi:hypothetical protein
MSKGLIANVHDRDSDKRDAEIHTPLWLIDVDDDDDDFDYEYDEPDYLTQADYDEGESYRL